MIRSFWKLFVVISLLFLLWDENYSVNITPFVNVSFANKQQNTPTPKGWVVYRNEKIKLEFYYPPNLNILVDQAPLKDAKNDNKRINGRSFNKHTMYVIGLSPKGWTKTKTFKTYDVSTYPLTLCLYNLEFRKAAELATFEEQGDRWVITGRQGITGLTRLITSGNYKILIGETETSIATKKGTNEGEWQYAKTALVNKDDRSIEIVSFPVVLQEPLFTNLVNSVRFKN